VTDPLDVVSWPLRTERLIIRRYRPEDVDAVWHYRQLPEVANGISAAPATLEDYREYATAPERMNKTLIIEIAPEPDTTASGATLIGDIMLRVEDGWAQVEVADQAKDTQAELGWVLDPAHGGRGYATEAVRAVIDVCFGPLGLRRVHAGCFAENEPSWRLMERLGMRREEFSRQTALHRSGRWIDGMNYALLADEWPDAAAASGPVDR
jgi:RimJ/RimL family protein N-acetyltransferase